MIEIEQKMFPTAAKYLRKVTFLQIREKNIKEQKSTQSLFFVCQGLFNVLWSYLAS